VDPRVGRRLFAEAIGPGGLLAEAGATRLLVTHQRQYLPSCSRVLVLRGGQQLALEPWPQLAALRLPELTAGHGGAARGGGGEGKEGEGEAEAGEGDGPTVDEALDELPGAAAAGGVGATLADAPVVDHEGEEAREEAERPRARAAHARAGEAATVNGGDGAGDGAARAAEEGEAGGGGVDELRVPGPAAAGVDGLEAGPLEAAAPSASKPVASFVDRYRLSRARTLVAGAGGWALRRRATAKRGAPGQLQRVESGAGNALRASAGASEHLERRRHPAEVARPSLPRQPAWAAVRSRTCSAWVSC
jgi:hypothetical protein